MDEDVIADTRVTRYQSSRRGQTSITHLMNFSSPPILPHYRNSFVREDQGRKCSHNRSSHLLSDKARYIHANYRFIVKPNGNYKLQATDADQPLNWNDILQVLVSSVSQSSSCPICLSRPVVPRMLTCGHILCLPCLIRYVHSGDLNLFIPKRKARWIECPICWDSVNVSEMRPVRWYAGQENLPSQVGEEIILRLISRNPGKILALPHEGTQGTKNFDDVPWYSSLEVTDYARIMKGGQEYMNEQFNYEIEDLQNLEKEDQLVYNEGPEWTRKAISEIYEAKKKIHGIGNPPSIMKYDRENDIKIRSTILLGSDKHTDEGNSSIKSKENYEVKKDVPKSGGKSRERENEDITNQDNGKKEHPKPVKSFFFYQALPNYYLAPLDIRILKSAYGSFDSFPQTLLPLIEHISNGHIVDNELRKRMKYLSHLPQGSEIKFLECNWSGMIVPEILGQFSNEIEIRRKRNNDKEIREEQERLLAEKAEVDTQQVFTHKYSSDEPNNFLSSFPNNSILPTDSPFTESAYLSSMPTSKPARSSGIKSVWGTTLVASSSAEIPTQSNDLSNNDGWSQTWDAELQIEDALITHAKDLSMNEQDSIVKPMSRKGHKKKAKKITLLSTNAKRAA